MYKKSLHMTAHHRTTLYVHIVLFFITIAIVLPIVYLVIKATQNSSDALSPSIIPGKELFRNVSYAWNNYNFKQYTLNTLIITISITIGKTIFSLLAALVIVYFKVRHKQAIFIAILVTLYIPTDLIAVGLFNIISQTQPSVGEFLRWFINPFKSFLSPIPFGFEWTNNYASVIVPFLASATGIFLFIQHFRSIPRSFAEVAYLEGMNPIDYMFKILIPISMNTIGALWVIQFISFWNQYFWPRVIIRNNDSQVVQVALRSAFGVDQIEWGIIMASALIVVIPPLIVFLILIKQLRQGVSLSTGK